ncbi:Cell division coordinator CpoB [Arenibacter antarcticus]|uniref:tRNA (Guanine-N1)-methyltransferase n=1 Tax=Arenibacter antarcticus TaxID=2040469 RepID=A0ABW5VD18_9FLAO|nr:tRNA (guanine-N1)-methyltransferase [Arenibacter sp. H213]MCM4169780.1 tRNA (guanine-N1)-methyltransferase [Arenibacter sp. H213]
MKFFKILFIVMALLSFNFTIAQEIEEEEPLSLDNGPISDQFEYVSVKSGNYRAEGIRYEVVKESNLDKLRQNVLDSINEFNKKATQLNTTIAGHEETIESLNKKLEETTNNLASVTEEKDSMAFLGILVAKSTYNIILWTIIGGLLLLLLFFIYKFRNSNILTLEAKQSLSEVETEYEDHRRRALEREQKISRQLQDEINKYKKSK